MFLPDFLRRYKRWCKLGCSVVAALLIDSSVDSFTLKWLGVGAFPRVVETLISTMVGATVMILLTEVEEFFERKGNMKTAAAVHEFFVPVAVLVGYAWKDEFKGAMDVILKKSALDDQIPNHVQASIASIIMLIIVIPAWKQFFLPSAYTQWMAKEAHERDEIQDKLKPVLNLPRWLRNDLEKQRLDWQERHLHNATSKRALYLSLLSTAEEAKKVLHTQSEFILKHSIPKSLLTPRSLSTPTRQISEVTVPTPRSGSDAAAWASS